MNGTSSLTCCGVSIDTGSIPHDFAEAIRRVSSCMRCCVAGDLDPAALDEHAELLVLAHALERQRGHLLRVVDREDEVRGVAGRAAGVRQRPLVDQRDVRLAEPRQVVGEAVADDPRADDHDALGRRQLLGRIRGGWPYSLVIYQMQVRSVNARGTGDVPIREPCVALRVWAPVTRPPGSGRTEAAESSGAVRTPPLCSDAGRAAARTRARATTGAHVRAVVRTARVAAALAWGGAGSSGGAGRGGPLPRRARGRCRR